MASVAPLGRGPAASPRTASTEPVAPKIARILEREGSGVISEGRFNIGRDGLHQQLLLFNSFFHSLLNMSMQRLILVFLVFYVTVYAFFGLGWYYVSKMSEECQQSLGIHTYRDAFHLSLETQQTIGFGVPDPYFSNCVSVTPLLVSQTLCGLLLDMVALNVLYQRFSSPVGRAMTVAFSEFAILQEQDGHVFLVFRFCEMRKQPLLDVYVRVYCLIRVENPFVSEGVEVRLVALDLDWPDGDYAEGRVLASLPVTVVHKVDKDSPLAPSGDNSSSSSESGLEKEPGEEKKEDRFTLEGVREGLHGLPFFEIIAVVCGTDENSGNTVEARFSYTLDELRWGHVFAPCVSVTQGGNLFVDFSAMSKTDGPVSETVDAPCNGSFD